MQKIKAIGQMVQTGEDEQTNKQTNGQTDGRTDATKRIISPASRSIINSNHVPCSLYSGKFTTPQSGHYLVQTQLNCNMDYFQHNIVVGGNVMTYELTVQQVPMVTGTTSAVFHLDEGEEVYIQSPVSSSVYGTSASPVSWFGITALYFD